MVKDNSLSSKGLDVAVHLTMLVVLGITLFPVLHVIATSLSHPTEIMARNVIVLPKRFTIDAYITIFSDITLPRAFLNSVIITTMGTAINIFLTVCTAYPLSKGHMPLRGFYLFFILITMFFSGGLIPNFLLINSLGMYNTYWALTLPTAISSFNLIVMMSFFKNFPSELEEAAKLDGASEIKILFRIVIPLSMAAVATISLFYAVGHWNSFFEALIYLRDEDKYPLQMILREIVIQNTMVDQLIAQGRLREAEKMLENSVNTESIKYATLVVTMIPMMIIYPFVQRHFVKGVMIGSLKG